MSGLYNIVFGRYPGAPLLLEILRRQQEFNPGRFRDAWPERDGDTIVIHVYTRNGGPNREDYGDEIASMRAHPWFLRDEDDSYDNTYAGFWFRVEPNDVVPEIIEALVEAAIEPVDTDQCWRDAIEALKEQS